MLCFSCEVDVPEQRECGSCHAYVCTKCDIMGQLDAACDGNPEQHLLVEGEPVEAQQVVAEGSFAAAGFTVGQKITITGGEFAGEYTVGEPEPSPAPHNDDECGVCGGADGHHTWEDEYDDFDY